MSVFNRILKEKGLLTQYATTGDSEFERAKFSNSKENENPNIQTMEMLKQLMDQVKTL
jgi:hypothetical protein